MKEKEKEKLSGIQVQSYDLNLKLIIFISNLFSHTATGTLSLI